VKESLRSFFGKLDMLAYKIKQLWHHAKFIKAADLQNILENH